MTASGVQQTVIGIETRGPGLYEFTREAADFAVGGGDGAGLLTAFVQHTSCSLVIQENADPDVRRDLDGFFRRLVPEGMDWFSHTTEGPDDMPAHIRAALTAASISVPVAGGRLLLGRWQGMFVFEHRTAPHRRRIVLHLAH